MNEAARIALPLTIERVALVMRYVTYILVVSLVGLKQVQGNLQDILVVTVILAVHHAFVHGALWTKRYDLFFTRFNFIINFLEISLIVGLTGPDTSIAYLLFYFFIIGFSVYERRFRRVMLAAILCAASFAVAIAIEKARAGIEEQTGVLIVKVVYVLLAGWLVAVLSERLRVTEERLSTQATRLISSEATLRTILNSAGDPIVVYDDDEFITEANARSAEFFGVPQNKLIGQRIRAYIFDDGTLAHKFANLRVRGEGQSEEIFVNAEGEERTVDLVVRSFIREKARYYVAIIRDVTDRKNLQEATRLANVHLERLNSELRQVDQMKTRFLASISRNMRSPLSAVSGYVEMLLEEALGEINADQRRALQTCRRGLLRVFRLIEDALDLQRLEAKRSSPTAAPRGQPGEPSDE